MSPDGKLDLLKQMIVLVGEAVLDGERHEQFQQLCAKYEALASKKSSASKRGSRATAQEEPLPDVHAEYNARSREDFLNWAAALKIPVLKRIVKEGQFDPAGRAAKWRKADKFGELIYQQLQNRAGRGEGFGKVLGGMPGPN